MRRIVVSDIHGFYNLFVHLLSGLKFNKNDKLILLGDYIDRGYDSYRVVKYIQRLQKIYNVVALKGNHEDMVNDIDSWVYNGGQATFDSYKSAGTDAYEDFDWFNDLPTFYEDEDFMYVHAGLNPNKDIDKQLDFDKLWIREDFLLTQKKFEKPVFFGHTSPVVCGIDATIFGRMSNNCIGIDSCVYGTKILAGAVIDDKKNIDYVYCYENKEGRYILTK